MADPIVIAILVALLAFIFFMYLMLRRTVTGFKEGVQQGSKKK
jgi:cell division protein FtsX